MNEDIKLIHMQVGVHEWRYFKHSTDMMYRYCETCEYLEWNDLEPPQREWAKSGHNLVSKHVVKSLSPKDDFFMVIESAKKAGITLWASRKSLHSLIKLKKNT